MDYPLLKNHFVGKEEEDGEPKKEMAHKKDSGVSDLNMVNKVNS